ncbi:MAG: glycosyltransferase [Bryobacteraceae bacterium]|nr:glycosyltransferase [Bryobacteraceae bacterium]
MGSADTDRSAGDLVTGSGRPFLLHVGSTIARKRIDVLLRILAGVRKRHPAATLLRVGGPLTDAQMGLARELGVAGAVRQLPFLSRETLAAVYRISDLVLVPSETEGFGLPVIEALACGRPVVASRIAPLQEGGGPAAKYCSVADIPEWVNAVESVLAEREKSPAAYRSGIAAGLLQASRYSWQQHAQTMSEIYLRLQQAP